MPTEFSEAIHAGEAIVSEASGHRSRDVVTIASGADVGACTILGRINLGAATSAAKAGGNTGNGAMGAITVGAEAQQGIYQLRITKAATNAGDFEVIDPEGDVVGLGTVAVAFDAGGLSFTLADGGTDFVVGDGFDITVAAGSGKYVALDLAATTGAQIAAGMLIWPAAAADADIDAAAIVRDAELNDLSLVWPDAISDDDKATAKAQLAELGIIVRS